MCRNANMNNKIKAIIFDLGQVLIDLTPPCCMAAFGKLGATGIEKKLASEELTEFLAGFELGNVSINEFCGKMRNFVRPETTNRQIIDAWNSFLGEIPDYKLDTLLELRKEYEVYLLSNTNIAHWEYTCDNYFNVYKGHQLNDFFDKAYTSCELHLMKPDPVIYHTVLNDIGLKPGEVFFLDDRQDNCQSARAIGMNVYNVTPGEDWRHAIESIKEAPI